MEKTKEIEQVTASEIVLYSLSETVDIEVHIAEESVWLTQAQIALLFDVKEHTITYHIKEIYRIQELLPLATTRKFRVVRKEGGRTVSRWLDFYNLDMILSIGYRVNTISGIRFRQWASQILKEYMLNGYTLNPEILQFPLSVCE